MVYDTILAKVRAGIKQFVVLVDPEKADRAHLELLFESKNSEGVDMVFLGGSTSGVSSDTTLSHIRALTDKPVVLFPGDVSQVTDKVDAVLFLSLISGRNPDYLIGHHVKAAPLLKNVEVIPVGYILVDGGKESSTELVSQTKPMSSDDIDRVVNTAIAGELLGHKMIYLEAGSGASVPVALAIISEVKSAINVPLLVGGGIKNALELNRIIEAGADIVVVGNALEDNPLLLSDLCRVL